MFDIETEWGQVHFSRKIVRQFCQNAVDSCDGKAVIYNFHGKGKNKGDVIFQARSEKATAGDIMIEGDDDNLKLTVFVVIKFGASISGTAEKIINSIYDQMDEVFGVKPQRVTLINTGTASRDVIPRHMEFVRTGDSPEIRAY